MVRSRRRVLMAATLLIAAAAAIVLSAVVNTVLLAAATSYVLLPVHHRFLRHGVPRYWSAIVASVVAAVAALLVSLPIVYVLLVRRAEIRRAINGIRGEVTLFYVGEQPFVFDIGSLRNALLPGLADLAEFVGRRLASMSAKLVVFAFVVFGLLYYHDRFREFVYHVVPDGYHDIADHTHVRVRDVLFEHFVLAFCGGAITFLFGLFVFGLLGYQLSVTLALLGALFWLFPIVHVWVFVLAVVAAQLLAGNLTDALLIGVSGAVFLVAIPGLLVLSVRRRLGDPSGLSAPAYFVGFVGGGLTIGPAGIVLGPLSVAVLLAIRDLMADDEKTVDTSDG